MIQKRDNMEEALNQFLLLCLGENHVEFKEYLRVLLKNCLIKRKRFQMGVSF